MAKRKPDPALAGQLDMFGGNFENAMPAIISMSPSETAKPLAEPKAANDVLDLPIVANDTPMEVSPDIAVTNGEDTKTPTDQAVSNPEIAAARSPSLSIGITPTWLTDEWWTTSMVCSFLKLGRKAIWERQRHPDLAFPQAFHFGSMRHRWRSEEIRNWARDQLK